MITIEQTRFDAMGTDVHVAVIGGPLGLVNDAQRRVRELEAHWSRFLSTSDVSRANAHAGHGAPVWVHPDTMALFVAAVDAWRATAGRFDPTVHDGLIALGYDRSFNALGHGAVDTTSHTAMVVPSRRTVGLGGTILDLDASTVCLPRNGRVDFGGIGKGLAADMVVDELRANGAAGAMVNIGGDLRASGRAPTGGAWVVEVQHPFDPDADIGTVAFASDDEVAVATSSTLGRRWTHDGTLVHHLIDPQTSQPYVGDIVAVTVLARTAAHAEVAATLCIDGRPWPETFGAPPPSIVFFADGSHEFSRRLRAVLPHQRTTNATRQETTCSPH